MKTNPVHLSEDLSPHLALKHLTGEYTCPECEESQIELEYSQATDGKLSLIEIIDNTLLDNHWCDQLGVCPECKQAFDESDATDRNHNL